MSRSIRTAIVAAAVLVAASTLAAPPVGAAVPRFTQADGIVRLIAPAGAVAPFPAAHVVRSLPGGSVAIDVPAARAAEAWAVLAGRYAPGSVRADVRHRWADHVPTDPLWSEMWGARLVRMPAAWTSSVGDPDVVIAVLDTGVDPVGDLAGAILPGTDIVDGDSDPSDGDGHGTVVAQVAAARIDNGIGGVGACPACSILPVRIGKKDGVWESDSATAIVWAVDHGATVINMSYGSTGRVGLEDAAVRYARSAGVTLVAAAGNDGGIEPEYPGALPGVIAVAATDEHDVVEDWSQRGTWVDVSAPGYAATPVDSDTWLESSGTSFASPMVAGLVGLLASAAPGASRADLEAAITSTAAPVAPDGSIGGGRVDAAAAIAALGTKVAPPVGPVPSAPVLAVTAPSRGLTYTRAATYDVGWTETLAPGATVATRTITQQSTPVHGGTCDEAGWAAGDAVPGEGTPFTAYDLADGTCYRWRIDLADSAGLTASVTTRPVQVDRRKPVVRAVLPKKLTRTSASKVTFRWRIDDGDAGSGIASSVRIVTQQGRASGSSCTGWRTWGRSSVPPAVMEDAYTIGGRICVRLRLTVTDAAGNATTVTLPAFLHR
jgi:hypothetical protein